jgi:hypothetical protein
MWRLNAEQTARLGALQRRRDLQHIGDTLAEALPDARTRLGDRWSEFIEHGATRSAAYGLHHMLCVARLLASWAACGADLEARQPWAAALLGDSNRSQGAKAYQLCVFVLEHLGSANRASPDPANAFATALRQIDGRLAKAGVLGSLLPREAIRLGAPCDIDAVELSVLDTEWRQHYSSKNGRWRREGCAPAASDVQLVHEALAEEAARLPEQINLLSHAPGKDGVARLRVRVNAEHRCDTTLHPMVQWTDVLASRMLRGDLAGSATFQVHAPAVVEVSQLPHMGEENSPQFYAFAIASCGLRARGVPVGELGARVAAYDATQHMIAWRREAAGKWELPTDAPPPSAPVRCRREFDGQVADISAWSEAFEQLDRQLQQCLSRLVIAWERESGVSKGRLAVDSEVLVGSAGMTWGWAEAPDGIAAPPYMRMEALLDLVACRLDLRFTGDLSNGGARSELTLSTQGKAMLSTAWSRGPQDAALFSAAAPLQLPIHQTFELHVQPFASAELAILGSWAPVEGSIDGAVGLEQRPDGPGLRWFVRLQLRPVIATLQLVDPLLGAQTMRQPLLPAQVLVDWSLA